MSQGVSDNARQGLIAALRAKLAVLSAPAGAGVWAPGPEEMAAALPGGGLALGALHEVTGVDYRATPAAWGFLLALAVQLLRARGGSLVWPWVEGAAQDFGAPYAPGLHAFGLDPARLLFVRCRKGSEALWVMEEALRHGATVIGARPFHASLTISRRLQLAAEQAGAPVLLLRRHDDHQVSAAVTRWRVAPAPAARDRFGFFAGPRWRVALEQARGGRTGEWVVEWNDETHGLRLPAVLGGGKARRAA
ncbi:MAG: ImuA protein [Alphaproteobacteria bacterium]|nr:ImuA protein [Alphaproteobacteria bacterium]MDE2012962.1 ImuA protein [Alphaproteobacteria bacterium]MDE2075366.1 ImuA protein [Alphaproteobacteria bacterium]